MMDPDRVSRALELSTAQLEDMVQSLRARFKKKQGGTLNYVLI